MQFVRKFGQGKGRFSLDRVMAKLDNTSHTAIAIAFLVMNLLPDCAGFFGCFYAARGKQRLFLG